MGWFVPSGAPLQRNTTCGFTPFCYCAQGVFRKLRAASFSVAHAKPVSWTGRSPGCEGSVMNPILNRIDLADPPTASGDSQSQTHSAEIIEEWLIAKLSNLLGVDPREIDVREPFVSYGLGSTEAVCLSGELADWLGRKVPADLAYEYP